MRSAMSMELEMPSNMSLERGSCNSRANLSCNANHPGRISQALHMYAIALHLGQDLVSISPIETTGNLKGV